MNANTRSRSAGSVLPSFGLGTWQWGDRRIWGYGGAFGESDARAAFDASRQAGVRFFDTAEIYGGGESERILGRFIRDSGADVFVATKFLPYPWRVRRGSLLRALEGSLGRLRLASVDLYQVHWPLPVVPPDFWAEDLAEAVRAGMTRAVGVSNYGVSQTQRMYEALDRRGIHLASNQVRFSLLDRSPEYSGLLGACRDLGVSVIAYSPLAQGLLTGKYGPGSMPGGVRRLMAGRGGQAGLASTIVAVLREIGDARGKTPSQVALNWLTRKGSVPIPGAKNRQQAEQNAGALGWELTEDEMARLDRASARV